jgi:type VI secretion system protein
MKLSLIVTSYQDAPLDSPISITLADEGATIGRRENNSLVLPDPKRFISGRHAIIDYQAPDYYITDTSTNGVIINQSPTPLGNGNSTKLHDGDLLIIGDYTLQVKLDDAIGITDDHSSSPEYAEPYPVEPLADIAGENLDLSIDPFGELDSDPVQKMIDENELIPAEWHDDQESVADPFAFDDQEFHGADSAPEDNPPAKDYDHVPAQNEAFQPTPGKPESQPPDQKQAGDANDIFDEDWFLDQEDVNADAIELADQPEAELKPPKSDTSPASQPIENVPTPPAAAHRDEDSLIENFLRGAELQGDNIAESIKPETFYLIGKILRASIQGTMDVLWGRTKIKNEMHLDVTMIKARENNPIKFSVSAEEALTKLLTHHDKGYLPPEKAIQEAFDDILAHQYSVIAGMQTALLTVLQRFDPEKLEQRLQQESPISASIPFHRQAKLWKLFEQLFEEIGREAEDNFYHLFGQAFAETYAQQINKLKTSKHDRL